MCSILYAFLVMPSKLNYPQVESFFVALLKLFFSYNVNVIYYCLGFQVPKLLPLMKWSVRLWSYSNLISTTFIFNLLLSKQKSWMSFVHLIFTLVMNRLNTYCEKKQLSYLNIESRKSHLVWFGIFTYWGFIWCGQFRRIVIYIQNPNTHCWVRHHGVVIYRETEWKPYQRHPSRHILIV